MNAPHPAITVLFAFGLLVMWLLPLTAWLLLQGLRDRNAQIWFTGTGVYGVTATLFTLQYTLPTWLAFGVGTTLVVVFYVLMHEALRRELSDEPTPWVPMMALVLGFGACYVYLDHLGQRLTSGFMLSAFTFAALALLNLRQCLRVQKHHRSRACWILAMAFGLALTINVLRGYSVLSTGEGVQLLAFTPLSNFLLVSNFLGVIFYSFGYWGFVLEKTQAEKVRQALNAEQATLRQAAAEATAEELKALIHQRDQMLMMNSRFSAVSSLAMFNTAIIHELSQPLQAIQLCLEGLQLKHANASVQERETSIQSALSLNGKLGHTITALRQLVTAQQPVHQPLPVASLLQDVLPIVRAQCEKHGVVFVDTLDHTQGWVRVDRVLLERVLLNMVANGLDAIRSQVSSRTPTLRLESALETTPSQSLWKVTVRDNGPGFSQDMLSMITQPLQTGKENGIGLGLALAHLVVRQWQGQLTVRNLLDEEGGGACVTVSIPMTEVAS